MSVWFRKDKRRWIAKFQYQGRQIKKEGFKTKREAVLWEAQRRQEINARPPKEIPSVFFHELATNYLSECTARMQPNTVRQKAFVYRSFQRFLGSEILADIISTRQITDYLNYRAMRDGAKAANRDLRDLKALYNWGLRQEIINCKNPCNPIDKYPEEPYRPDVPPPEDIDKIRMVANQDERDFIEVIYHLLARKCEVVRLTWEDVNFERRSVRLYTRKRRGGELQEDYLPMNDTLHRVLLRRWKHRDKSSPNVFTLSGRQLRYMMERLCKQAGVKEFGFHAIRHHVASLLNDTGKVSMKQMQKLLRHRKQATSEMYLHSIEGSLYEAAKLLDGKVVHSSTPNESLEIKKAQN